MTRTIRASKRWTQNCRIDVERTRVAGGGLDLKLADLAALTGDIERTLRTQYSVSSEMEQNFEEEITVTVPPKTALVLIMDWKTIIQEGYVRMQDAAGRTVDVPFEVPLEVTFDQKQLGRATCRAKRLATQPGTADHPGDVRDGNRRPQRGESEGTRGCGCLRVLPLVLVGRATQETALIKTT